MQHTLLFKRACGSHSLLSRAGRGALLLLALLLGPLGCAWGQTTLINETFETGNSFTLVNGSVTNKWVRNTAAEATGASVAGSTYSLYVSGSTASPPAYTYNNGNLSVHAYQDITVPAGQTSINLAFNWRGIGENNNDYLRVSYAPTTFTPTVGLNLAVGTAITGTGAGTPVILVDNLNTAASGVAAYATQRMALPASLAGTSFRLIFTWTNDNSFGSNPPASIDNVLLTSGVPLSGTYTINNTLPTNVSGTRNFNSFTDAFTTLNTVSLGGAVTINVAAGQTFTEDPPVLVATGTATNTITVQRSGTGANPVIRPSGTAGATDAGIALQGGDYFAFNGIDITAQGSAVEYGYLICNGSATNGALNNTFQNATITLNQATAYSSGVEQSADGTDISTVPTSVAGCNQNNSYLNLQVYKANYGIAIIGYSDNYYDLNTEIGACTIGGTTAATGIVGASTNAAGIYMTYARKTLVRDNLIQNVSSGTTSGYVSGIYAFAITGGAIPML